jgi:hypothetical protein
MVNLTGATPVLQPEPTPGKYHLLGKTLMGDGINTVATTTIRETIMPRIVSEEEQLESAVQTQADERCDEQRATLRLCLDEIAEEATSALQGTDLNMPVYFSVPSSGAALLTFCTPLDPTEGAWEQVTAIICDILLSKIAVSRLVARPLACAPSGVLVNALEASGSRLNQQQAGDPVA